MATSRLLLADDSVTIQKVVNLTFSGEGIDVVCVSDGNSAIDLLREEVPDLVMADVNIPGVNGYEICEKVKSMDTTREIPVILLVGSFEPFDEEEANRVGAEAHLTKPFESIATLVEMVNGFLDGTGETEQPRFDDTVEYPPDHEMVVSATSIPFSGGFEDETIETERVGSTEKATDGEEDVLRPVVGLETFGDEEVSAPESYARDDDPAEFDTGYDTAEEPEAAEEVASYYYSDTPDEQEGEQVFADHSGSEDVSAPEKTPVDYGSWNEPEPAYDDEPAEGLPSEDEAGTEVGSEVYYREESYSESSYHEGSFEAGAAEAKEEAEEEATFSPIPLGSGDEDEQASAEFGAVTVELDESDLLELPVDLAHSEPDAPESFQGDPFERTIRDQSFRPKQFAETAERGHEAETALSGEISEELVNEIVRRVVERLSEKAVREIAWEVVPEMAELIIKKMTEQKLNE